jgi:hypothetical protein
MTMKPVNWYNVNYEVAFTKGDKEWTEKGSLQNLKAFFHEEAKSQARDLIASFGRIVGADVKILHLYAKVRWTKGMTWE